MNNHIRDLLSFLDASPTSVQASQQIVKRLEERGFAALDEGKKWKLKPGAKYYLQRETSVVALVTGSQPLAKTGFQLAAAHIDSPGLKLKPSSLKIDGNVARVAVEVYGGPIISSWIDRELGIAGRAAVNYGKEVRVVPVDLQKPVAVIPNAAIHYGISTIFSNRITIFSNRQFCGFAISRFFQTSITIIANHLITS